MKLFFSNAQFAHEPKQYMVHGRIVDPFENPSRATALIEALATAGLIPAGIMIDPCKPNRARRLS